MGHWSEGLEQGAVVARAVGKGGGGGGLSGSLQFCRNFTSVSKIGRPAKKGVSGARPERRWLSQDKHNSNNKTDKFLRLQKQQMGQAIQVNCWLGCTYMIAIADNASDRERQRTNVFRQAMWLWLAWKAESWNCFLSAAEAGTASLPASCHHGKHVLLLRFTGTRSRGRRRRRRRRRRGKERRKRRKRKSSSSSSSGSSSRRRRRRSNQVGVLRPVKKKKKKK